MLSVRTAIKNKFLRKEIMKVLVACEESQRVCIAFREKGHEAYSCDIQECSGGHPEWHIKDNVLKILNPEWTKDEDFKIPFYGIWFLTADGVLHRIDKWDLIIAHPPCTYLTNAGMCNFTRKNSDNLYRLRRLRNLLESVEFVNLIWESDCDKVAIENPVGVLSTYFCKPTQIIHPWEYGHHVNKSTCLWLKGLPTLNPTQIVSRGEIVSWGNGKKISRWYRQTLIDCSGDLKELSRVRSQTFRGIARAMAQQWG